MTSGLSPTRINNEILYVLQNPLQPAAARLLAVDNILNILNNKTTRFNDTWFIIISSWYCVIMDMYMYMCIYMHDMYMS